MFREHKLLRMSDCFHPNGCVFVVVPTGILAAESELSQIRTVFAVLLVNTLRNSSADQTPNRPTR